MVLFRRNKKKGGLLAQIAVVLKWITFGIKLLQWINDCLQRFPSDAWPLEKKTDETHTTEPEASIDSEGDSGKDQ